MFKVSFMIDDRKHGDVYRELTKIGVYDLTSAYLINAVRAKGEVVPRSRSAAEAFVAEMNRRKIDQVNASGARDVCKAIGLAPTAYFYVLARAMEAGLLHKGEKHGLGWMYVITKRLPAPQKKGAK